MLQQIDNNLWVCEQSFKYFGLNVGTRMTLVRLDNGELVAISPVDVNPATISQINALGNLHHIIAPNCYHYLFAAKFKEIYPQATFWAAPGLANKKPELPIDENISPDGGSFIEGIEYLFIEGFNTLSLKGSDPVNECAFFHATSRTLILTDIVFHFDRTSPFLTQLGTRILGGYESLSPSILERIATKDKAKVRKAIAQILNWDFDRVIVAHGTIVESGGKQELVRGYASF